MIHPRSILMGAAGLWVAVGAQAQTQPAGPSVATPVSLYAEPTYLSLTSDRRLRRVGDIVSVVIYENSSASSTADTGANRNADVGVSVDVPRFVHSGVASTNNDFSGGGRTQRAGNVLAQLSVSVVEITPSQDLRVSGEQVLEINGEKQTIRLEGRIRPTDISQQNTVLSTRVADAKISFVGDGVLGDRQKPGWWQQLLTLFGL